MKKYLILLFLFVLAQNPVICQSNIGYKIKGSFENISKDIDTLILVSYKAIFNSTATLAVDTAIIKNKSILFKGKENLNQGMYFIFEPKQKTFFAPPFLVTKQQLTFSCDLQDIFSTIRFKNSKENTLFFTYQKHVSEKQELRNKLKSEINQNEKKKTEEINKKINKIDNEMKLYIGNLVKENQGTFFSKYLQSTQPIDIPEIPLTESGEKDIAFQYNYIKKYFWDHYDLSDSRMLYTVNFAEMMEQYFNYIDQSTRNPDSINVAINIVAKKAELGLNKNSQEMFRYVIEFILTKYEKTWKKVMGMDKILVYVAENYVMQDLCSWIEEERLNTIIERAEKIAPNLLGKKAPEFHAQGRPFMRDTLGNLFALSDIKADYTLLVFYSPDCGHCKKQMPKIKSVYDSLITAQINIKTLAITNGFEEKEWKEFIKKYEIGDWINLGDQPFKIRRNYMYKMKESENTFVSLDKKEDYEKGTLKRVEVESYLVEDDNILNIELLKQVKQEYKNVKFILNDSGNFICNEELEPRASSNWREKYDIVSTPVIYLLNKEKRIVAKGINHSQIGNVIGRLEEISLK